MKMHLLILTSFLILLSSCINYDEETEQKFQENKTFMLSYLEELGFENSPFLTRLPSNESDKQKKKMIALMSKEEIKVFVDRQTSGVPRIHLDLPRSQEFLKESEEMNPEQAYDLLINKYPEILNKN